MSCRSFNSSLCHLLPFLLSFVTVSRLSRLSDFTLFNRASRKGFKEKKEGFSALYKNPNTFLTLWFLNGNWAKNQRILVQWNPVLTATSVIQSPHYYGQFFLAWQNGHTFSDKKPSLMRSPVNTGNSTFLNPKQ